MYDTLILVSIGIFTVQLTVQREFKKSVLVDWVQKGGCQCSARLGQTMQAESKMAGKSDHDGSQEQTSVALFSVSLAHCE